MHAHDLGGQALWMGLSWAGRTVLPLVALAALAPRLGPAGVAEAALALAVSAVLAAVIDWGASIDGPRRLAVGDREAGGLVWRSRLLAACLAIPPAFALAWLASGSVAIAAVGIACGVAQALNPLWLLQGLGRLRLAATSDLIASACGAAVGIVCILADGHPVSLVLGFAGGAASSTIIQAWHCRDQLRRPVGLTELASEFRRGSRLGGFRLLSTAYGLGNPLLLTQLGNLQQLGWFIAAERLGRICIAPANPLTAAWSPMVAGRLAADPPAGRRLALRLIVLCACGGIVAGALLALFAPAVALRFLGDDFAPSLPLLPWLGACVAAIWISQSVALLWHVPRGHDTVLLAATGAACVANVLMSIWAVPRHGALGMAWGLLAAESVATCIVLAACLLRRSPRCVPAS